VYRSMTACSMPLLKKCHEVETDHGRQRRETARNARSVEFNTSRGVRPYRYRRGTGERQPGYLTSWQHAA
jgi:hypothetical protein